MSWKKRRFDFILKQYKHKDMAFKLTNVPGLNIIGEAVIDAKNTTLTYIPVYENMELPEGTVAPVSIIEHFINEASHHQILSRCPCRSENNCGVADPNFGCTFLGPSVLDCHPDVGRLVSREEALEHLHQATEAGLVSCLGKFKGDAIMMGLKDHRNLMTICHCCTCCCVSTSFHYASPRARDMLVKLEGVEVEITEKCNGCALCVDTCMFKQIEIENGVAVIGAECKGCGRCAMTCKRGAVKITVDNPAYVDECIARIGAKVSVR